MKQSINSYQFKEAFKTAGRGDQFSYKGLDALFDWLEEEDDGGYELDVIALCCDFTEYESAFECLNDYMTGDQFIDEFVGAMAEGDDELEEACKEYLNENTCVIHLSNGAIIIQAF
jgi:hypothetical protein